MTLSGPERATIEIEQAYALCCSEKGDIHEHMPVLRALAKLACLSGNEDVDNGGLDYTIVEFGVRSVVSTWAFLAERPSRMLSVDLEMHANVDTCKAVCQDAPQPWTFLQASTLELEPVACALLFIDTLHTYAQLRAELLRHGPSVFGWIVLHDTEAFGDVGQDGARPGLKAAVNEFLALPIGCLWEIALHLSNCNGLTVLRRRRG